MFPATAVKRSKDRRSIPRFRRFFLDITHYASYTYQLVRNRNWHQEMRIVTKKEIVKQISERLGLTQLKTKEIVQKTFDSIIETLLSEHRIELRNFGVFEVKRRKARKARNPRTGERVDVEPKNVVTFKPGKEMEERVRQLNLGEKSKSSRPTLKLAAVSVGDDDDDK
jgi:nucleoid DNA-binding protein